MSHLFELISYLKSNEDTYILEKFILTGLVPFHRKVPSPSPSPSLISFEDMPAKLVTFDETGIYHINNIKISFNPFRTIAQPMNEMSLRFYI
jgi:hypothetical protein